MATIRETAIATARNGRRGGYQTMVLVQGIVLRGLVHWTTTAAMRKSGCLLAYPPGAFCFRATRTHAARVESAHRRRCADTHVRAHTRSDTACTTRPLSTPPHASIRERKLAHTRNLLPRRAFTQSRGDGGPVSQTTCSYTAFAREPLCRMLGLPLLRRGRATVQFRSHNSLLSDRGCFGVFRAASPGS